MIELKDKTGKVLARSKNLRGPREWVRTRCIEELHVLRSGTQGILSVHFADGSTFTTVFQSYEVLLGMVARWRSVYGWKFFVNGQRSGEVSRTHTLLARYVKR